MITVTFQVVKLIPSDNFRMRIGKGRMDRIEGLVHADTLFSALVNIGIKLHGEEQFIPIADSLCISSVFYGLRIQEGKANRDLLFFPRPKGRFLELSDPTQRKKQKRISWLSAAALSKIFQTFDAEKEIFQIDLLDPDQFTLLNPQFCITSKESISWYEKNGPFFRTTLEPKVPISRTNTESLGLYYQAEMEFCPQKVTLDRSLTPFFFFLIEGSLPADLISTLHLFIEEGLGGERASGKGTFASWEYELFPLPQKGDIMMLLSSSVPRREEMDQLISYELLKREGFLFWNQPMGIRKKSHYVLGEGSLVKIPFWGTNLEVSPLPDKRAIAYGKAMGWPFGLKGGQE